MNVIECDQCRRNVEFIGPRLFDDGDYGSFWYVPCPYCKNMINYEVWEGNKNEQPK